MRPADVATAETMEWLIHTLPPPPIRILEVGCGRGELAGALLKRGFDVLPLDSSADAVAEARRAGIAAVQDDFLRYEAAPFDVLLFTRSLHHMDPLRDAIARAHALLGAGGLFIAEEFAVERADRAAAGWFYDMETVLGAAGVIAPEEGDASTSADLLQRWRAEHESHLDHPLHTGAEMLTSVRERFEVLAVEKVPYLYRYLAERLEASERGHAVARCLLGIEQRLVAERSMPAIGLRIVARRAG